MTKITFTIPDSIAVTGGGFESTVDVAKIAESALVDTFLYGLGRIVQDKVNSRAKVLRDERGLPKGTVVPESEGFLAERIAQLYDGTLGVRTNSGESDVEKVAFQLGKRAFTAFVEVEKGKPAAKELRAALTANEPRAVNMVKTFMAQSTDRDWAADAAAEIERRKEEARKRAEDIANALSAVAKAKIDLDSILNG